MVGVCMTREKRMFEFKIPFLVWIGISQNLKETMIYEISRTIELNGNRMKLAQILHGNRVGSWDWKCAERCSSYKIHLVDVSFDSGNSIEIQIFAVGDHNFDVSFDLPIQTFNLEIEFNLLSSQILLIWIDSDYGCDCDEGTTISWFFWKLENVTRKLLEKVKSR